jgi:hypothetical protein
MASGDLDGIEFMDDYIRVQAELLATAHPEKVAELRALAPTMQAGKVWGWGGGGRGDGTEAGSRQPNCMGAGFEGAI